MGGFRIDVSQHGCGATAYSALGTLPREWRRRTAATLMR